MFKIGDRVIIINKYLKCNNKEGKIIECWGDSFVVVILNDMNRVWVNKSSILKIGYKKLLRLWK